MLKSEFEFNHLQHNFASPIDCLNEISNILRVQCSTDNAADDVITSFRSLFELNFRALKSFEKRELNKVPLSEIENIMELMINVDRVTRSNNTQIFELAREYLLDVIDFFYYIYGSLFMTNCLALNKMTAGQEWMATYNGASVKPSYLFENTAVNVREHDIRVWVDKIYLIANDKANFCFMQIDYVNKYKTLIDTSLGSVKKYKERLDNSLALLRSLRI